MAFKDRVTESTADVSIAYQYPYCCSNFASFQVSILEDLVEA
jgi:hypothetical protein